MSKQLWHGASTRLIPCLILLIIGAMISNAYGNVRHGSFGHRIVALAGVVIFIIFATAFLHVLTTTVYRLTIAHHFGKGRAAAIRFILRIVGYVTIMLSTLELIGISIERLLLGSAVLGIILGVAAQQALANFFASIVLIVSHPFAVGENVTLNSGALGGAYTGMVLDIGMTHTRLRLEDDSVISLPNAALLSMAAITPRSRSQEESNADSS